MKYSKSNDQRQRYALIALLLFAVILLFLLNQFITPFLGAIIFYELFKKAMKTLVERYKWRHSVAAVFMMTLTLIIVIVPVFMLANVIYQRIFDIVSNPGSLMRVINVFDDKVMNWFGIEIFSEDTIKILKDKASNLIPPFLNKIGIVFIQVIILFFILFYMLVYYKEIPEYARKYLPFEAKNTDLFLKEMEMMIYSNVFGAPLLATFQGISAIAVFWLLGVPDPAFWGIMCGLFSFIPFVGSALVWGPASIFLFSEDLVWQSVVLLIYGMVVISNIDNVFRFILQKRIADVHPLVTVFGVLMGLEVFGLAGIIFGPLILSFFIIGVKIYRAAYPDYGE